MQLVAGIPTPHKTSERELIVSLAKRYRMPAVYPFPFWVRDGGLISYGVDLPDLHRRSAGYIDRILKGLQLQSALRCRRSSSPVPTR
jgi:putative ABC transport system substrate-binding protein